MNSVSSNNRNLVIWIKKIVICILSIAVLGISIAINAKAMLGNDPISVFYDGLGISLKINMGIASNIINIALAIVVFIFDRKYIHVGTLIYAIELGLAISLGLYLYDCLGIPNNLIFRVISAIIGYSLSFISLGAFVAIDIGIDPWTASCIIISNKTSHPFGKVKAFVDTSILIIGFLLRGNVGIMTLISAIIGGPVIQKISEFLDKVFTKVLK